MKVIVISTQFRYEVVVAAIEEPTGQESEDPTDHVSLVLTWDRDHAAKLIELRDNSAVVPIVPTTARGRIEITYDTPKSGAHYIEFKLEFVGKTLRDLKAEGRIGRSEYKVFDQEKKQVDRWYAEGMIS